MFCGILEICYHGLEIAIIEIENIIGRTKKAEKLCAVLKDYKRYKAGEQE